MVRYRQNSFANQPCSICIGGEWVRCRKLDILDGHLSISDFLVYRKLDQEDQQNVALWGAAALTTWFKARASMPTAWQHCLMVGWKEAAGPTTKPQQAVRSGPTGRAARDTGVPRPGCALPAGFRTHSVRQASYASKSLKSGAPDWIRTSDPCLRRAVLYPAELRVQARTGN